MLVGFVDPV